ncbi:hypothetical protein SDC9_154670 [bioreactor metagenome]|uniref:Uncharacterized protein n=1 Tax=bioreactor metagenome TaxID=1076179 RepID=A0A645F0X5_9ZZZZ
MPRLVVKPLVGAQTAQQCNAACGKQRIGADDDQQHGDQKQQNCRHGAFDQNGNGIAAAQRQHPQNGQWHRAFGLALANFAPVQQFDRLCQPHLTQVREQGEEEQHQKQHGGRGQRRRGKRKTDGIAKVQQRAQGGKHAPTEQHAHQQPNYNCKKSGKNRLKQHHQPKMVLFHAEYII